jgi:hypothetical protein
VLLAAVLMVWLIVRLPPDQSAAVLPGVPR